MLSAAASLTTAALLLASALAQERDPSTIELRVTTDAEYETIRKIRAVHEFYKHKFDNVDALYPSPASLAAHAHTSHSLEEGAAALRLLDLPLFCLFVGLVFDAIAGMLRQRFNFPTTVFQFTATACLSAYVSYVYKEGLEKFEEQYIWVPETLAPSTVMELLLPVLIFESSFRMNANGFKSNLLHILTTALACYMTSVLIHWGMLYLATYADHTTTRTSFAALLFATMISATDPVAVVALLEELGAPTRLKIVIEGESLINDGIAILAYEIAKEWWRSEDLTVEFDFSVLMAFIGLPVSVLVGYWSGLLCMWAVMNGFKRQPKQQHAVILFSVMLTYHFVVKLPLLRGSGIVALVVFGLTMAKQKHYLPAHLVDESVQLWQFLSYWANCIIFMLAGHVVGREILTSDYRSIYIFLLGVLLFPIGLAARAVFMFVMYLMEQGNGARPPVTHFICYVWGGLRGALPILLSFELLEEYHRSTKGYTDAMAVRAFRAVHDILLLVCSSVISSLVIQGLSFEWLLKRLGLTRHTRYVQGLRSSVSKAIQATLWERIKAMQLDERYAGTNWSYVDQAVGYVFREDRISEDQHAQLRALQAVRRGRAESHVSMADSVYQPFDIDIRKRTEAATKADEKEYQKEDYDFVEDPAMEGVTVTKADINRAYMMLLLAQVQHAWQEGILSGTTIAYLVNFIEHSIDCGSPLHFDTFDMLVSSNSSLRISLTEGAIRALTRCTRALKKLGLLDRRPRAVHPKSHEYWVLFSTGLSVAHAAFVWIAVHAHSDDGGGQQGVGFLGWHTETYYYADIVIALLFLLEEVILWRDLRRASKMSRRNLVLLYVTIYYTVTYAVLILLTAVAVIKHDKSATAEAVCLNAWHGWREGVGFCRVQSGMLTYLSEINAILKVLIALPLAIHVTCEALRESMLMKYRVALSSLTALKQLTEDLTIDKFEFGTMKALREAAGANALMMNLVGIDVMLEKQLKKKPQYASQIHAIKTRQSARRLLKIVKNELNARIEQGLLRHEDLADTFHYIDEADEHIEKITRVHDGRMIDIVGLVRNSSMLIECAHSPAIMNVVNDPTIYDQVHSFDASEWGTYVETSSTPGLWFLVDGVVTIFNEKYTRKRNYEKLHVPTGDSVNVPKLLYERPVKFSGEWLNEHELVDPKSTSTRVNMITKSKICVLPAAAITRLLEADDQQLIVHFILRSLCLRKLRNALRRGLGANKSAKQFIDSLDQVKFIYPTKLQPIEVDHSERLIVLNGHCGMLQDKRRRLPHSVPLWTDRTFHYDGPVRCFVEPLPPVKTSTAVLVPMWQAGKPGNSSFVAASGNSSLFSADQAAMSREPRVDLVDSPRSELSMMQTIRPAEANEQTVPLLLGDTDGEENKDKKQVDKSEVNLYIN